MSHQTMKPTVHCIMMATLDGKIGSNVAGMDIVDDYLEVYRTVDDDVAGPYDKSGNAWMCGRVTSELYFADKESSSLPIDTKNIELTDFLANPQAGRYFVTVDTKGSLRWKSETIEFFPGHGTLHLIIVVTESTPKAYLAYLQNKHISYVIGGREHVEFALVLEKLTSEFGVSTLLLEGGGKLNGSFADQKLIDEIHLLLLPRVLNKSDAPSLFDSTNTEAVFTDFELVDTSVRPRNSVLLHYKKKTT